MKLRPKVRLIVRLTWLLIILMIIGQSYYFTLQDYLAMEKANVHDIYVRNQEAIKRSTKSLSAFVGDWAHWNDSFKFTTEKYNRYIINKFNLQTPGFEPITPELLEKIERYSQLTKHDSVKDSIAGAAFTLILPYEQKKSGGLSGRT